MEREYKNIHPMFNFNKEKFPNKLYHYTSRKKGNSILLNKEIHLSNYEKLNDPFDTKIEIDVDMEKDVKIEMLEKYYNNGRIDKNDYEDGKIGIIHEQNIKILTTTTNKELEDRKKFKIFCLSEEYDNILMWSHYTEGHEGLCIEFNINNFIENIKSKYTDLILLSIINYQSELPYFNLSECVLDPGFGTTKNISNSVIFKMLKELFLTKYTQWSYEKEWRLIMGESDTIKIVENCISGIYLGLNTTKQEEKFLIGNAKKFNPNIKIYRMKKSKIKYPLEYEDITTLYNK